MAAADAHDAGAADAHDAGAADARDAGHDAGGRPRGLVGHGGFHGGLWQRLMLMMLERLMLMTLDMMLEAGRGGLWATEASMEACGSG